MITIHHCHSTFFTQIPSNSLPCSKNGNETSTANKKVDSINFHHSSSTICYVNVSMFSLMIRDRENISLKLFRHSMTLITALAKRTRWEMDGKCALIELKLICSRFCALLVIDKYQNIYSAKKDLKLKRAGNKKIKLSIRTWQINQKGKKSTRMCVHE